MTDTENPYAPPTTQSDTAELPISVRFQGVVTKHDIVAGLRETRPAIVGLIAGLCCLLLGVGLITQQQELGLTVLLCASGGWLGYRAVRHWTKGQVYLQNYPQAVGPLKGEIAHGQVRLVSDDADSLSPLSMLTVVECTPRHVALSWDAMRQRRVHIPWRFFTDVHAAKALLSNLHPDIPLSGFDPRLIEVEPVATKRSAPDDAVPFDGFVKISDCRAVMNFKRQYLRLAAMVLLCNLFPLAALWMLPDRIKLLSLIAFVVVNLLLAKNIVAGLLKLANPEQDVFRTFGWLSDRELVSHSALGMVSYRWSAFDRAVVATERAALFLPGKATVLVLFAQRQFASEADWRRCCRLISNALPQSV